jgi:hypothetical protein
MRYAHHTGTEWVPEAGKITGSRQRLIPETDTERALLLRQIRGATIMRTENGVRHVLRFEGRSEDHDAIVARLLDGDSPTPDDGWYAAQYTVDSAEGPGGFDPFRDDSATLHGYACVVEHPGRSHSHPNRLQVFWHFPRQDGCMGVSNHAPHLPVALWDAETKTRA